MPFVSGDRLGPYEVEHLLGAGGMGEVYRGVDTRLGRAVALKVIAQRLVGDEGSRRRFETEARAASALNHPAIVTIYDIGEGDGLSWIAMELVEGRTLREAIADSPVSIGQAWSIARQLAEGLAAAHAKGIVHRDLKPENVMLTHEGGVKILDFGVARQVAPASPSGSALATATDVGTVAGAILGTVGYMSPEQATGRNVDFRSDQFSFGAVIYELLSGQRAFQRPTAVETLSAILRDEPPPLASTRADAPDALQRVIGRCLEKTPEQRFASTRELATALALMPESSTAVASSGTVLPDPAVAPAARRALSRLRLAALAAVALAVASGAFLWNRRDGTGPPALTSVAVLPFESSAQDPDIAYIADGLTDGLIDHLARAKSLKVQARATVMRFKGNSNPQEAARALGVGAVVTGALSRRGTQIVVSAELIHGATGERLWGQTFDRPLADLMRVQDSIVLSIAEGLQLRLSGEEKARLGGFGTDNPEAYELFLKGRFVMQRETEEDDLEALRLFKLAAEKDPNFLDAHLAVANTYGRMVGGGLQSSREAGGHADEALAKAFAIDPNNVGVRVAMTVRRFVTKRDWAAAEREFRAVMDDPAVLRSTQWHPIALLFVAIGRPDEAAALAERALVVDPGNLESRAMLGNFRLQAGRLDEALKVYEGIAAEEPEDSRALFGIADVYRRRGDFARAAETRRKAYVMDGLEDEARAFARVTTEADYAKAELAVARAQLRDLQDLSKQRFVSPLDIARLHAQVGNREEALALLERATDEDMTGLSLLKVDQAWDSVRADPRFAAVVRRIGIP
jgi:TolB-like protein/tetratricopeptide (TPR) repeat protein/tRNA A-37 threonylcarbamoyl transferase component Bud32